MPRFIPFRKDDTGRVTGFYAGIGRYPRSVNVDVVLFRKGRGLLVQAWMWQVSVWRNHCYVATSNGKHIRWFWGRPS